MDKEIQSSVAETDTHCSTHHTTSPMSSVSVVKSKARQWRKAKGEQKKEDARNL